jgi:hypothetical protein
VLTAVARGEATTLRGFLDATAARYAYYLRELEENYQAQRRWPSSRFWARRRRVTLTLLAPM